MAQQFPGITEKLKRTKQNIDNLNTEIARFFEGSEYPVLPQDDRDAFLEAIAYHSKREIPLRFSVLAGEVVHHLRSCLDHVVWHFSTPAYRQSHPRGIEFPIFKARPIDKNEVALYDRKIHGVTDTTVRRQIESLQPYNSPDPVDSPLLIIHNLDIIDKHRELVICDATGAFEFPVEVLDRMVSYHRANPNLSPAEVAFKWKSHGKVTPQVAFRDFGRRPIQPVGPGLEQLFNFVIDVVAIFEEL